MKLGEIIIWLIIFIVGSLIVTFIIDPVSFQSFKGKVGGTIGNILPEKEVDTSNLVKKEIGVYCKNSYSYKEEYSAGCFNICQYGGNTPMDFEVFRCEDNKVVCYCK